MLIIVLPSIWGTEGPEFKSGQPDRNNPDYLRLGLWCRSSRLGDEWHNEIVGNTF